MCSSFMRRLIYIADKKLEQALRRFMGVCPYKMVIFPTSFRHKIKKDKQSAEHRKVRLVVHDNYDDYDALATDYEKKMKLTK